MNGLTIKRNRIAALICCVFIIAATFTVFAIPISADSTTTDSCTIFYLPNYNEQGQFKSWTFVSDTYYFYTGTFTVYMVYKTDKAIGNWSLHSFEGGARITWDDFVSSSDYAIAIGYVDTNYEFYGDISLEQVLTSSWLSSNPQVEYMILCTESTEQGAYYIAKSLCAMAEIGTDAHFFLDDIRHSINSAYDNGYDLGEELGMEIAYDDIINEQKPIWEQEAFFDGMEVGEEKGKLDEYNRVLLEDKPIWERDAFNQGKQEGYIDGVADAENFTPQKVPFAIMDSIYKFFHSMLNFEMFGINFMGVFSAIITFTVGIFVLKKVL